MNEPNLDKFLKKVPKLKNLFEKTGLIKNTGKSQENRLIFINNIYPDDFKDRKRIDYGNNRIRTSKYSLISFLPKNLYEQFRRVANFYFLVNILITFLLPEPPKNPFTSMIPLAMVVTFTAIKQAYEDFLRHQSDSEVNNDLVRVIKNGNFVNIKRKDIKCGDIIEVKVDNSFPCDMLLLHAQTEDGSCHVTTANLDGETNLKLRSLPKKFPLFKDKSELINLKGRITCDKPNVDLYEFKGKLEIDNSKYFLSNENLLLRGSTLKIASVIYGCAIYTGKDTKLMLNSKFKASKLSCIERTLNKFILFFLALLFLYATACLFGSIIYKNLYTDHWYLRNIEPKFYGNKFLYYLIEVLFYLSLFSNIIPISMYISIESQKFLGTKFFEWDINMYDENMDQPAKANNSNINEDLGQVEYLFTDKTGTLTENEMIFRQFYLNGNIYDFKNGLVKKLGSDEPVKNLLEFENFFLCLCLCHTVQVDYKAKEKYQASSPDEYSFIIFCEKLGIVFKGDVRSFSSQIRSIDYFGQDLNYELLHILEFDSFRAEDSILSKCTQNDSENFLGAINQFANHGWRTLAMAYKTIEQKDYEFYDQLLKEAYNDLSEKRNETLKTLFDTIESNLDLIGCSAVEDRLQDDVSSTLVDLRRAGIKIWVLTGDKKETAINISDSCKHFSPKMHKMFLTDFNDINLLMDRLNSDLNYVKDHKNKKSFAYIIDGKTLSYVFKFELGNNFRNICLYCDAVLCCRMSPSQKAEVVKLVKESKTKPITCAIGDGANDVSMIQEAHIGLGIFGKEGRHAVRSSDFAFAKFKHLKRALLVHGYLFYSRLSTLVLYFFYKNLVFVNCQIFYAPTTGFSVQSLYHGIYMMFYNVFFTSFPIVIYGLLEQKINIGKLEMDPKFYKTIRKNKLLSLFQFAKWNLLGFWHSLVAYYSTYFLYTGDLISIAPNGQISGEVQYGTIVFIQVLIIVHLKLFIEWKAINLFAFTSYFMSLLAFVIYCIIPNSFIIPYPLTAFTENQSLYWVFYKILSYPSIWLCIFLSSSIALIPDILIHIFENVFEEYKEKLNDKMANRIKSKYLDDVPHYMNEQHKKREKLKRRKSINWKIQDKYNESFKLSQSINNQSNFQNKSDKTVNLENSEINEQFFRYHREYRF
ncbi:unnamed protein product [Brachionus calyciflorus]|uniref:Phospholipid-transporting ATPase n=1 Tax=Brachionus calyciflorus TaxID=104777 RepID=A0A813RK45_9BILA|nr:unnamed protein product [Brachionus calyciflorus]